MGPKKPKDPNLDDNYWRTYIESTPLNEETWTVKAILIEAAGSDQDRMYLNKFELFAAEERRFVIKNICKTETIFMVNQLGGEKKVKDDNLRVFEEGQAFLKDKRDIPPDILALIIKHLILKMKDEYLFIRRQKLEVKKGMRRESTTMVNTAEVKGTVNANITEDTDISAVPTKDKTKKNEVDPVQNTTEVSQTKKYNTLLRVRGEEWRDKIYVDDFPIDGPNLYVAITGFVEPQLAGSLIKIGVPLKAIVQIRIDPITTKIPSTLFRTTKRGQSQTEIITAKCQKFWEDLQLLCVDKNTCDDFKDTAFIVFSPPYHDTESLSGSPEKIYDELCYLMYDIQDLTRQHIHYLENMDVTNIPQEKGELFYKSQKVYNEQIAEMPLECVTIYFVLDSILQAVSNIQQLEENSSNTSLSTALTINQTRQSFNEENKSRKAEILVRDVFDTLCNADSKKNSYRITYGEEYENLKDPVVINYGDFAKYKNFQLGNINMDNIIQSMIHGIPIFNLWKGRGHRSNELDCKVNFHVNVLLSCFDRDDVENAELTRLIHILACRKMYNNRSSLKLAQLPPSSITEFKKVFLKRTVLAEPLPLSAIRRSWSSISPPFPAMLDTDDNSNSTDGSSENYRIKFLFDCPDISELISAAELASETPINHMIDDFEYFEYFSKISGFQTMLNAFITYNCVEYKYCEVTDSLILMFLNNHDKDGVARDEWRCHLPTPLCLQDFFNFVLDEHYEWIKNEEEMYSENVIQKSQSEYKSGFDLLAGKTCIENPEVSADLLMEGSLKHKKLANIDEKEPEDSESKTNTSLVSFNMEVPSKSSKKTKSTASTPKNFKQNFVEDYSNSVVNIPKKPFYGYNLSDRRVEIFGKDSSFFSKDGTKILTKYTIMIPENSEYITLKVAPGNNNAEFWMHKVLGDIEDQTLDICKSFRISTKDNLLIYIKKQSFEVPQSTLDSPPNERLTEKDKLTDLSPNNVNSSKLLMASKSFYSLNVTWPNGLITENVFENNSDQICHIKQYYIIPLPNLNEDMRCVNLDGDVIIFKTSGIIEVLRPDGSFIKITKYEKRINNQDILEDRQNSDASSDISKKGKTKGKNKPSKASSKSSKNIIDEADKISDIKEPDYELFIDEYEIIEADGLKQIWVDNILVHAKKLLIRTATDFCSEEVFSRRMDGTSTLLNKNGIQIVTFPDQTRIITTFIIDDCEIYPEWTEEEIEYFTMFDFDIVGSDTIKTKESSSQHSYEELHKESSYMPSFNKLEEDDGDHLKMKDRTDGYISVHIIFTIEHMNFSTVTVNKADSTISVTSPKNVSVVMSNENTYKFNLDDLTTAAFDGEDLNINYKACLQCQTNTSCQVKINDEDICNISNSHECWLKMRDSFNKQITIDNEGNIVVNEDYSPDKVTVEEEDYNNDKLEQTYIKAESAGCLMACKDLYEAMGVKFFVLQRKLTCSELVHRTIVEKYKQNCQWQPWCSLKQYNTFGDNRSILSIVTPVHLTETEKWIMESQYADKPKYLTYKDLKTDSGKGFYHWMRPYERFQPKYRKPENVIPERLPRAFILRNLEQQWDQSQRENLKGGKELLTAILQYRRIMESNTDTILHVPIRDERSEEERKEDDIIRAIAHRTYEDLKYRLGEDVQKRAKLTITTKPPKPPEESSLEGEMEEIPSEMDLLELKRASTVKEVEEASEMNANRQRYWRRRAEENKEEQFYKYLLREGSVPPYFRNVLGGAIWWEMNHMASEAVTKAERRKMKCVCEEQAESTSQS